MVKYFYKRSGSVWLEWGQHYGIEILIIALLLFNTYLVVSLFPCNYHRLLVAKYGCKREKLQEAKWRSVEERRPMCKMERAMDVDLFLELKTNGPRTALIILQSFMRCFYMRPLKDKRRQNVSSAEVTGGICPS